MKFSQALALLLVAEGASAFSVSRLSSSSNNHHAAVRTTSTTLFGIMDEVESDAFDLSKIAKESGKKTVDTDLKAAYEVMLAELVFSTNDPRVDIVNKFDLVTDPPFLEWLDTKVDTSNDPQERIALRDLYEMILDVKTKVEVNALAEERAAQEAEQAEQERIASAEQAAEEGRAMSNAEVLKKAVAIDAAAAEDGVDKSKTQEKTTFLDSDITPEIRLSYESLLKKVLPPYKAGDTPASIVFNNYEQFDAQLVKLLTEQANDGNADSKALLEALAVEQQKRITAAAEALKQVLSTGDPMRMEGAIVKMAREGKIDEPFLLLLQANEQQAAAAGAAGPEQLMARLRKRAMEEKDKQMASKEIRLIRQLLREDDAAAREKILEEAFTPKAALLVPGTAENARKAVDGEAPDEEKPMPEVPPPDFISACKAVMLNFGNLGMGEEQGVDLAARIKKIAAEAEVVATRIYGKGMSLREQQDRAWKDESTSVFDLERMEIEAERMGEQAPWTDPNADDFLMPGFDASGKMQVGGG